MGIPALGLKFLPVETGLRCAQRAANRSGSQSPHATPCGGCCTARKPAGRTRPASVRCCAELRAAATGLGDQWSGLEGVECQESGVRMLVFHFTWATAREQMFEEVKAWADTSTQMMKTSTVSQEIVTNLPHCSTWSASICKNDEVGFPSSSAVLRARTAIQVASRLEVVTRRRE